MKVYRVVPNNFVTGKRLNTFDKVSSEYWYYNMGYTSFSNECKNHDCNNLECENKYGKYFFLFAEDAIWEGIKLINSYHRLRAETFSMLEYDIPEDIIIKNIGYGAYSYDILHDIYDSLLETFIEQKDFGDSIISSVQLDENKKQRYFIQAFQKTLEKIKEYKYCSDRDFEYYMKYFSVDNLSSLTEEQIKDALINSKLYQAFLKQQCDLISSPFISGKSLQVNMGYISGELRNFNGVCEYYQNLGVKCDFSKEHQRFKNDLLYTIESERDNKEKIKKLLLEIK